MYIFLDAISKQQHLVTPYVYSNTEQDTEVIGCSSPVAVNRFADERMSIRRSGKVLDKLYKD